MLLDGIAGVAASWLTLQIGTSAAVSTADFSGLTDVSQDNPLLLLAGVTVLLGMALRRFNPTAAYAALLAAAMVRVNAGTALSVLLALPAAYPLYLVAVTRRRRDSAIALGAALVLIAAEAGLAWRNGTLAMVTAVAAVVFVMVLAWASGYLVRQRRCRSLPDQGLRRSLRASP
jgi:Ca2+/Na+ antiporter